MDHRPKRITDHLTISMKQAAAIFMRSPQAFKTIFIQVLQSEIRHAKTSRGIRLLLEDTIRCAYPDAPEATIYMLAYEYTRRDAMRRKKIWGRRKNKQEKGETGET